MKMRICQITIIGFLLMIILSNCKKGPKIIAVPVESSSEKSNTGIFDESSVNVNSNTENINNEVHTVTVNDVLATDRYVYLNVTENDEPYWIATGKREIIKGETYFYRGGLLKTNFESKEHNRIFDKIYLVSNIVPATHGNNNSQRIASKVDVETHSDFTSLDRIKSSVSGSIKISELIADPEKYEGTTIQLTGECVKLNPNIMGRNWIHLKDGSKDDYDLVITSNIPIQEGSTVTMKGVVSLDRDFGAGYKYDVIIEDGSIVN